MKRERGFALLDTICGVLILAIGVTCLLDLTSAARQNLMLGRWKSVAVNQAESELAQLQAAGLAESVNKGRLVPGRSITRSENGVILSVSCTWLNPGVAQIEIEARCQEATEQGKVILCGLLAN